jgi:hypothetical protein
MIDTLIVALVAIHTGIALCMAWIALTVERANIWIVSVWFVISVLTAVMLGRAVG